MELIFNLDDYLEELFDPLPLSMCVTLYVTVWLAIIITTATVVVWAFMTLGIGAFIAGYVAWLAICLYELIRVHSKKAKHND